MKHLLCLAAGVLFISGCTSVKYGEVTYTSFLNKKAISELDITVDGDKKRVKLKGYRNDQVEALTAITEAAVHSAVKSLKP